MAIGRREVLDIYLKIGLRTLGRQIKSGAVTFELMTVTIDEVNQRLARYSSLIRRLERDMDWCVGVPFGGASGG
jgi:hypothetical protein